MHFKPSLKFLLNKRTYLYKLLFYVYLLLLFLHYKVSRYGEIYPSLVFPAFQEAPTNMDTVHIPVADLYALDKVGHLFKVSEAEFFNNLYSKHTNYFLNTIVNKEGKFKGNDKLTEKRRLFIEFAQKRLVKLYPNKHFIALVIVKGDQQYDTKAEHLISDEKYLKKYYIYFNEI